MSVFCVKNLDNSKNLGWELQNCRLKKELSIDEVSKITHINTKYLTAIENGDFSILPRSLSHRQAYIKSLCEFYQLNSENVLYKFRCEGGFKNTFSSHPKPVEKHNSKPLSMIIKNFSLVAFVFLFIVYLGLQIRGIIIPPKLILLSPAEGTISYQPEVPIQGETEKESQLVANGKEIKVDENGRFNDTILLSAGVNTITLSTTKKHGKTTTIVRHVVVSTANRVGYGDLRNEAK
jgi:cytoskeletal protein RodZ